MSKTNQLLPLFLLFVLILQHNAAAQTVVGAASGKALINNQIHEWSVGEMCAVTTAVAPALIVTQGFLQPQETPVPTGENVLVFGDLQVMPNPAVAIATLRGYLPSGIAAIAFQLLDAKGALLKSGTVNPAGDGQVEQDFDLSAQPAGTYFLNLQMDHSFRTFSMVKI